MYYLVGMMRGFLQQSVEVLGIFGHKVVLLNVWTSIALNGLVKGFSPLCKGKVTVPTGAKLFLIFSLIIVFSQLHAISPNLKS